MRARAGASGIRRIRGGLARARHWTARARHWTALAVVAAWLVTAATTLATDPTASPAGGDVRTTPAAPGVVGDPLAAVLGVVLVGAVVVGITLAATALLARR